MLEFIFYTIVRDNFVSITKLQYKNFDLQKQKQKIEHLLLTSNIIKIQPHISKQVIIMFSKFQFMDAVKNPLQKIKASIKDMIGKQKVQIIQIIPNKLYHISTPTQSNLQSILQQFKSVQQFQLWNIGQYSYSQQILSKLLQGRKRNSDGKQIVYNLTYQYFSNIPFCQMIKSVQSIEAFLSLNQNNKVYIHCQDNKRRSAVFLACYIFLTGLQTDIVKAILTINKNLSISIQDKQISQNSGAIYKSQHLILKNLMNYINNSSFINKNGWNLKKILINNAPKIQSVIKVQKQQKIKFKVLLQIRSSQGIIYKKIYQDEFIEGQSLCLRTNKDQQVVLKDDFLVIIKYVYEKKGYSILRSQLNTNFIYDCYFRVQRNDMDLSINNAHPQNQTVFMDLLLQANQKEQSQLSKLNILKQNNQNQILQNKIKQTRQDKQTNKQLINESKKEEQEQQDGFGILDEQQQAEHNQKMQKQIQQELARQLQNIRKKRGQQKQKQKQITNEQNQQVQKTQQIEKQKDKKEQLQQKKQKSKQNKSDIIQGQESQQKTNQSKQTKQEISVKLQNIQSQNRNKQILLQNKNKQIQPKQTRENKQQHSESNQSSDQQSSSQSSSDEEDEQQEDLDDYLTKLQKQAQRHQ